MTLPDQQRDRAGTAARFRAISPSFRPETYWRTMGTALMKGVPPSRALTPAERFAVAVLAARPTHRLDVSSKLARREFASAWHSFVRKVNGRKHLPTPLIYLTAVPRAVRAEGYHAHALVWEFLPEWIVKDAAQEVGLGSPQQTMIPTIDNNAPEALRAIGYPLCQFDSVFDLDRSGENEPVERHQRAYLYPQHTTLARHCPELLSALKVRHSAQLSDAEVTALVPRSREKVRKVHPYVRPEGGSLRYSI